MCVIVNSLYTYVYIRVKFYTLTSNIYIYTYREREVKQFVTKSDNLYRMRRQLAREIVVIDYINRGIGS